ncbi:MAG: hypothetical protein PSV46_24685 [Reyranella sp.]|nr:hypothetical protein [Reyranella sp.]
MVTGILAVSAFAQTSTEFRDPKNGKVWTPYNVSQDYSLSPAPAASNRDKAFDPQAQSVVVEGVTVQRPRAQLMGVLPVTAGQSVPFVTLEGASLQAVPGERWITALYLTNNSGATVSAVVGCLFTNAGRKVEDTRVIVPPAGPGERLALQAYGPPVDIFVDRVTCQIISPV